MIPKPKTITYPCFSTHKLPFPYSKPLQMTEFPTDDWNTDLPTHRSRSDERLTHRNQHQLTTKLD